MFKPTVLSQFGIPNNFSLYPKKTSIFIDGLWFNDENFINSEYRVFIGGLEPKKILDLGYKQEELIKNADKFDLILTSFTEVLNSVKHANLFSLGSSWVRKDFKKLNTSFELSFLCGPKNHPVDHPHHLPEHSLRHEIYNNISKIKNIPIKLLYSIDTSKKDYIFNTSQYSIIVENTKRKNHFTEKLIDCLITKTIPVYYGCPNIGDFFNKKGIITFNSIEDLFSKVNMLSEGLYNDRLDIIEENYNISRTFADFHSRVDEIILKKQTNDTFK